MPYIVLQKQRNLSCCSKDSPDTNNPKCRHTKPTGKHDNGGGRKKTLTRISMGDMLLKANCFDSTLNCGKRSTQRSAQTYHKNVCAWIPINGKDRFKWQLASVLLVSTSKCYAKVHPCQENKKGRKKKRNQMKKKKKKKIKHYRHYFCIVSCTLENCEIELPLQYLTRN